MKKKLLITLGCSYTEGYGCYENTLLPNGNLFNHPDYRIESENQYKVFHEHGWPNRLGKKLNYDKVINLGLGGSGTSGQSKQFYEKYLKKDLSDYDVLIVWLLSDPSRLSFYTNHKIDNIIITTNKNNLLERGYIELLNDLSNDTVLEQLYYIKTIEQVCKLNGYSLLLAHSNVDFEILLKKIYSSNHYFSQDVEDFFGGDMVIDSYKSPVCNHPNELGYELLSQKMFDCIKTNHPNLINKNLVESFEWIWDGSPYDWRQDFI